MGLIMSELSEKLSTVEGLTISSKHIGLRINDSWEHDLWTVDINYNDKTYTTEYSTGLGHRKLAKQVKSFYQGGRLKYEYRNDVAHTAVAAAEKQYTIPVEPELTDVMYSIVMDASSAEDTFEDWCYNLGYDTDSRKALDTYLKCQEARNKFIKVFGEDFLEEIKYLEH
jgi:hypothetical protein